MGVPVLGMNDYRTFAWATPSAGKELHSGVLASPSACGRSILAVERLRDQISPHLNDFRNPYDAPTIYG